MFWTQNLCSKAKISTNLFFPIFQSYFPSKRSCQWSLAPWSESDYRVLGMTDRPLNGWCVSLNVLKKNVVFPSSLREFPSWYRSAPVSCTTPFLYPSLNRHADEKPRVQQPRLQGGAKVHAATYQHIRRRRLQYYSELQRSCQPKGRLKNDKKIYCITKLVYEDVKS